MKRAHGSTVTQESNTVSRKFIQENSQLSRQPTRLWW